MAARVTLKAINDEMALCGHLRLTEELNASVAARVVQRGTRKCGAHVAVRKTRLDVMLVLRACKAHPYADRFGGSTGMLLKE